MRGSILALVLFLFAVPIAQAQYTDEDVIRGLYRQYLDREADGPGLQNWLNQMRRGMPIGAVHSFFLGSPEFFARTKNDPATFVAALYVEVLGREASADEIGVWLGNYRALRGDRAKVAAQFLTAAQAELKSRPAYAVPAPAELANAIFNGSRAIADSVRVDLAGTAKERNALRQANLLVAATDDFRVLVQREPTPERLRAAYVNVIKTFYPLRVDLYDPPGAFPNAARAAYEFDRLLDAAQLAWPTLTEVVIAIPDLTAARAAQLNSLLFAMTRDTHVFLERIRPLARRDDFYRDLQHEGEHLHNDLHEMRGLLHEGTRLGRLRDAYREVSRHAVRISFSLRQRGTPLVVQHSWAEVEQHNVKLAALLGARVEEVRPVVVRPPFLPDVPVEWTPPPSIRPNTDVVRLADRALVDVSGLIDALAPSASVVPGLPQFLSEARALRIDLSAFRRRADIGAHGADLRSAFRPAQEHFERMQERWPTLTRRYPELDTKQYARLTEHLERLGRRLGD